MGYLVHVRGDSLLCGIKAADLITRRIVMVKLIYNWYARLRTVSDMEELSKSVRRMSGNRSGLQSETVVFQNFSGVFV